MDKIIPYFLGHLAKDKTDFTRAWTCHRALSCFGCYLKLVAFCVIQETDWKDIPECNMWISQNASDHWASKILTNVSCIWIITEFISYTLALTYLTRPSGPIKNELNDINRVLKIQMALKHEKIFNLILLEEKCKLILHIGTTFYFSGWKTKSLC